MTEPQDTKSAAAGTTGNTEARGGLAQLNARTAKRQHLLLAGIGAVLLGGVSWIFLGSDHAKKLKLDTDAQTIETCRSVNSSRSTATGSMR
jgi:hypothetical protein